MTVRNTSELWVPSAVIFNFDENVGDELLVELDLPDYETYFAFTR